ncbi:MAG: peptide/nickel transport system permease protein, partial [Thermoleophilaceae bacterium]|nr:peptide/nickel transport system permease protein [Thermoleophilaceae bacterium]
DEPLPVQYVSYVRHVVLDGNLGRSFADNEPVSTTIASRLPATIELALFAMVFGTLFGIGLGALSAVKRNTWVDTVSRTVALAGVSLPAFWIGVMAIAVFSVHLGWLPAGGSFDSRVPYERHTGFLLLDGFIDGNPRISWIAFQHLLLPGLVLGIFVAGYIGRITRMTMLEALSQDYIRTAVAKGLPNRTIVLRHALRTAALPVVTVIGLQFGLLLAGAAVTETVFAYPGMGKLLVDSIRASDFPQIQASILILAGTYCVVNAVVDTLYAVLDPRVRVE